MEEEKKYYAHSLQGRPPSEWQPLEEHLENVAKLAAEFAKPFGGQEWARLAGLWHDLGKYNPAFQRRLHGEPVKIVHSEAGGHLASLNGWSGADKILSWLIMGHHSGLADFPADQTGAKALSAKMQDPHKSDEVLSLVSDNILTNPLPSMPLMFSKQHTFPDLAFFIRMLFSCLVDADFLDTERFIEPSKEKLRQNFSNVSMERLLEKFDSYMLKFKDAEGIVNKHRAQVLFQCRVAAEKRGVFSLTVPTGGGKTLASLAFALEHAVLNSKRRIIYVIPYTSIIEQTVEVFRSIPGFSEVVLEHHSNLVWDEGEEDGNIRKRMVMENWDAPLVVTTNVQFFESLYSNKSSHCRKLHNIADSVVVFDEAQCLPPAFLRPCVFAVRELARHYGVTPVLCTATQPVLDKKDSFDFSFKEGFEKVIEIIEEPDLLSKKLQRVKVERFNDLKQINYPELADKIMAEEKSLLCIVNRKPDARKLTGLLPYDLAIHLSTNMCAAHRLEVFREIKRRLSQGIRSIVISTSLVEAGVDLDFPVVYRALAGLDSIAQASGRCNREGKLDFGRTVVFVPENQPNYVKPSASLALDYLCADRLATLLQPETFQEYFNEYFFMKGTEALDRFGIRDLLPRNIEGISFHTASEKFRLIDDDWQVSLIVPYGESQIILDRMISEPWNLRKLSRKLQRYSVNVPRHIVRALIEGDYIHEIEEISGMYSLHTRQLYDLRYGFVLPDSIDCFDREDLIV